MCAAIRHISLTLSLVEIKVSVQKQNNQQIDLTVD
jgi:hypothetical protein